MKKLLLSSILLSVTSFSAFACTDVDITETCFSANYSITKNDHGHHHTQQVEFGRYQQHAIKMVLNDDPNTNVIEHWLVRQAERPEMFRHFTEANRSIHYSFSDLGALQARKTWQQVSEMLPSQWLEALTKSGESQFEGFKVNQYQGSIGEYQIELSWIPAVNQPASVKIIKGEHITEMHITQLSHAKQYTALLSEWDSYYSVDYADIGDMENDPFVSKMINQGFIEHTHH